MSTTSDTIQTATIDDLREELEATTAAQREAMKQGRLLLRLQLVRHEESLRVAIAYRVASQCREARVYGKAPTQ